MKAIIVIKSYPNTIPSKLESKVFEWDVDEFSYSDEALHYIELLMMEQRAFTVDTSEAFDYSNKRIGIVEGSIK